nr:MAG TPA: hypothetical protein [Caudoviricetes sp.]
MSETTKCSGSESAKTTKYCVLSLPLVSTRPPKTRKFSVVCTKISVFLSLFSSDTDKLQCWHSLQFAVDCDTKCDTKSDTEKAKQKGGCAR